MFPIEVRGGGARDEELTAVAIRSGIRHGNHPGLVVFVLGQIFIGKRRIPAVDTQLARPVVIDKIATLQDKPFNHPMEGRMFVPRGLFIL